MGYSNSWINGAEKRRKTEISLPRAFSEFVIHEDLPPRQLELLDGLLSESNLALGDEVMCDVRSPFITNTIEWLFYF
jgi:hypothetical protein